jgi:energy-coupling factor transport system permease protein
VGLDRSRLGRQPPRALHPGAWWLWASALAVAASRTTNPLLLVLLVAVVGYVVAARRPATPWSSSFAVFLRVALVAVVLRVALFALLAPTTGTHVLVRLPQAHLPSWLAGLRLGGPIALEGLLASAYDGLRLAVVLVCVGAANSLTSPRRLLKSLPPAQYEAGVAVTVALAVVPQAVVAVGRVRTARRLRGRRERGWRAVRSTALPVLEGALDRAVELAAAMEARGFGRRGDVPATRRRLVGALTLGGLVAVLASSYALLDASAPRVLGLPLLSAGTVAAAAGVALARRGGRTRYRPDPWRAAEWLTVVCGAVVPAAFAWRAGGVVDLTAAPPLPALPALALVAALVPAWATPPVPRPRAAAHRGPVLPPGTAGAGARP